MRWKTLGLFIATIAFSMSAVRTGLAAQNERFLGIWERNIGKASNYAQQTQMIINVPAPGGFTSIRATIGKDGKSSTEVHPVAFDGKPYQTTGGDPREISYKRINANTVERTQNRNGKISADTEQVSKHANRLTWNQENALQSPPNHSNSTP